MRGREEGTECHEGVALTEVMLYCKGGFDVVSYSCNGLLTLPVVMHLII